MCIIYEVGKYQQHPNIRNFSLNGGFKLNGGLIRRVWNPYILILKPHSSENCLYITIYIHLVICIIDACDFIVLYLSFHLPISPVKYPFTLLYNLLAYDRFRWIDIWLVPLRANGFHLIFPG